MWECGQDNEKDYVIGYGLDPCRLKRYASSVMHVDKYDRQILTSGVSTYTPELKLQLRAMHAS